MYNCFAHQGKQIKSWLKFIINGQCYFTWWWSQKSVKMAKIVPIYIQSVGLSVQILTAMLVRACRSVSLFVCVCLYVCLSVCLSACLCLHLCLFLVSLYSFLIWVLVFYRGMGYGPWIVSDSPHLWFGTISGAINPNVCVRLCLGSFSLLLPLFSFFPPCSWTGNRYARSFLPLGRVSGEVLSSYMSGRPAASVCLSAAAVAVGNNNGKAFDMRSFVKT